MGEGVWQLVVDLPATDQAAAVARRLVGQALLSWQRSQLYEDAKIVVSELVTNAVQHASGTDQLQLEVRLNGRGCVNIGVRDGSPHAPVIQDPAADDEAGRGLVIVERLARRWGVDLQPGNGKRVWAELV